MTFNMTKTPMNLLKDTAVQSLKKHGIEADGKGGIKVRLVLDHSGSMVPWYRAGAVQRLTEQVLGLASAGAVMRFLIGFFKCVCGKIHCYSGVTRTSICKCGENLWDRMFQEG